MSPPAPFGRAGTAQWIEAVAKELCLDTGAVVTRAMEETEDTFVSLREEARERRLGFVIRGTDVRHLVDPAQTWGIPLLVCVEEMGFSVEVLVYGEPGTTEAAVEAVRATWPADDRLTVTPFLHREELAAALEASRLDAVYSEHFFDRRVTESGLASFSSQYFERGLDGATRTLRRLLELCRLPFYSRYGRHLRRSAEARGLPRAFGIESSSPKAPKARTR